MTSMTGNTTLSSSGKKMRCQKPNWRESRDCCRHLTKFIVIINEVLLYHYIKPRPTQPIPLKLVYALDDTNTR